MASIMHGMPQDNFLIDVQWLKISEEKDWVLPLAPLSQKLILQDDKKWGKMSNITDGRSSRVIKCMKKKQDGQFLIDKMKWKK